MVVPVLSLTGRTSGSFNLPQICYLCNKKTYSKILYVFLIHHEVGKCHCLNTLIGTTEGIRHRLPDWQEFNPHRSRSGSIKDSSWWTIPCTVHAASWEFDIGEIGSCDEVTDGQKIPLVKGGRWSFTLVYFSTARSQSLAVLFYYSGLYAGNAEISDKANLLILYVTNSDFSLLSRL